MRRILVASCLLLLAGTASCVIVDPACNNQGGATIFVSPTVVLISVGEQVTPNASQGCYGSHHNPASPHWSLANAADSSVIHLHAQTGRITGRRTGQAIVVARSDDAEPASITVTVR